MVDTRLHDDSATGRLLVRVRAALPTLAANAARTEQDGRPAADSLAAVREAGVFGLSTPRHFGGLEADARTAALVLAELGSACPSTAWVAAVSAGATGQFATMMSDEQLAELFSEPDVHLCGSASPGGRAEQVAGGLRLTGRWAFASGCEDATWAVVAAPVFQGDQPVGLNPLLVPVAELGIDRTWRVAGLQGTGSHTLVADDVFVPGSRVVTMPTGSDGKPDFSARPAGPLIASLLLLAPLLGAARGARDVVETMLAGDRAPFMTSYQRVVESPAARHWFAEADHLIDTAAERVRWVADTADAFGPGTVFPLEERSRMRMHLTAAGRECRQAVDRLLDLHGASGFALDNPLQRFWRDLEAGTRHPQLVSYITAEDHGRVRLDAGPPVARAL
jgi:alkylation response protein AidB-like acyl-CoA dehydrogenase